MLAEPHKVTDRGVLTVVNQLDLAGRLALVVELRLLADVTKAVSCLKNSILQLLRGAIGRSRLAASAGNASVPLLEASRVALIRLSHPLPLFAIIFMGTAAPFGMYALPLKASFRA